jgi:uncharacterized membrane protein YbhN (UPF0104 family)
MTHAKPFSFAPNGRVYLALKIILSAGLLWFLIHKTKFDFAELARADPRYLLAAYALLCLQPVLGGLRWRVVLQGLGADLPPSRAIAIHFISCFFNLILPALVGGDVIRVWYAGRERIKIKAAVSSVIADRLVALAVVLGMIVLSLPFAARVITDAKVLVSLRAIGAAGIAAMIVLLAADRLLKRWKNRRWAQIVSWPSHLAGQILLSWPIAWRSLSLSLGVHIMTCLAAGLIAQAYGTPISIGAIFVLVPPVILASSIPISLGGWGVREAAMVAALASIGIAGNTAFLIALTLGFLVSAAALPGLVFWIGCRPMHKARRRTSRNP